MIRRLLATLVVLGLAWPVAAQVGMPDVSQMNGKAIPAPELPAGTVTVRVVREAISNNIEGQSVTLIAGMTSRTATTDARGRAEFPGLPRGGARAETTVDGERLVSDPFEVPTTGGLRVILVAGVAKAAQRHQQEAASAAATPPQRGAVVFGGASRVLIQFNDDSMQVFYVLDVVNRAAFRVDIGGPLIIDLPSGAGGARVLEGSSPTAKASGNRITVLGPFAPGTTAVQIGFELRYDRSTVTFAQAWPAPLDQVTVGVQQVGAVTMRSAQFAQTNQLRTDDGVVLLVGRGVALAKGTPLVVELSDLPLHSRVPRDVALALAGIIVLAGIGLAARGGRSAAMTRQALLDRREALLDELARMAARGETESRRQVRVRDRRIAELEDIYAELDAHGHGGTAEAESSGRGITSARARNPSLDAPAGRVH